MTSILTRLPLAVLALVGAVAIAQAQTQDDRAAPHADGQSPVMPPEAGMPMPGPMGKPEAMGGDMGGMMPDMMRRMTAGRGMEGDHSGMGMPFEHVDGRIAYLKAELKITDGQAAPWNALADAMRANAAAMRDMHQRMTKGGMPTSLPDRLMARQSMMSGHIDMLKRMEAAAKPLYAALSPDQRKLLDQMTASPMDMM